MNFFLLILGLAPSFTWLIFYLQEDLHPEPKAIIIYTFVMGALFALVALILQLGAACGFLFLDGISCAEKDSYNFTTILPFLILFAFIEEVVKFLGAYVAVHKNPAFDEPIDAMLYLIIAGLGFAAVENLGVVFSKDSSPFLDAAFKVTSLRFVGATLLHTLTSATVGYYWALSIRHFKQKGLLFVGLFLATSLHTIFNFLILKHGKLMYTILFVAVVGFFVLNDFEKLKTKAL